jgi:hypothetical protein
MKYHDHQPPFRDPAPTTRDIDYSPKYDAPTDKAPEMPKQSNQVDPNAKCAHCGAPHHVHTRWQGFSHQFAFRDPVLNDKAPEMPKQSEPFVSGMGQDEACPEVYRFGLVRIICRLKKGHPGEHQASNMAWPDPAPNVTTAPPAPSQVLTREQAISAGLRVPHDAVEVHLYGHSYDIDKLVTTAPEEAAARETQSAEPTVEDTLRIIRKMEQCTGDAAKVLLMKNLFRRLSSAREAQARHIRKSMSEMTRDELEFELAEADFDFGGWRSREKSLRDCLAKRDSQIAELLARLDAIADLATTDGGPVQPRPQDKVQK